MNGAVSASCGINTGFIVIPAQGAALLKAIEFVTSMAAPASDPLSITVEGNNGNVNPGREMSGVVQCFTNNVIWYTNYRVLVTSKRGNSDSVQYSGVRLLGHENPIKTWFFTSTLNSARDYHTASVLKNGKVLVAGGRGSDNFLSSAELCDLSTNTWPDVGYLNNARSRHTASILYNGKVLVTGGRGGDDDFLKSAELYETS